MSNCKQCKYLISFKYEKNIEFEVSDRVHCTHDWYSDGMGMGLSQSNLEEESDCKYFKPRTNENNKASK